MRFFIVLFVLSVLMGCSSKQQGMYVNNLECIDCWRNKADLSKDFAHSGMFSSKMDSLFEYSTIFEIPVKSVLPQSIKKVLVILWVYFPQKVTNGNLVIQTKQDGVTKFWIGYKLEDQVKKANKWTEVTFSTNLPDNISNKDSIGIYVTNPQKNKFYVDDFDINFE